MVFGGEIVCSGIICGHGGGFGYGFGAKESGEIVGISGFYGFWV